MKEEILCTEGNHIAETNYYCDICGKNLLYVCQGIPYELQCSYGSDLDGNIYHFCCLEHLNQFVQQEIAKGVN